MMDELLTTKQLLELLKIDRTTVYRMLNDGRLTGVKIGGQWRFRRQAVEELLSGASLAAAPATGGGSDVLPVPCVQAIQDVFAEVAGVGAVTVLQDGQPLTRTSNDCRFCRLILASPAGRAGCLATWRALFARSDRAPGFMTCHAGLQCACAHIRVHGAPVAAVVAGQFYVQPPGEEQAARLGSLAESCGLDAAELAEAASGLRVLTDHAGTHLAHWLDGLARTLEEVGRERAELMGRLRRIAEMTALEPV